MNLVHYTFTELYTRFSELNFINFFPDRVIDGFETLDDLEKVPVNEKTYRPTQDLYLRRVTIHANPLAD